MVAVKYEKDHLLIDKLERKKTVINNDNQLSTRNKELIIRYLNDAELGKTIKTGRKKKIGPGRLIANATMLHTMATKWFCKDLDQVTQQDMEIFILELERGIIKTTNEKSSTPGKPYSEETKKTIKKFIKKFYKWLLTNSKYYPEIVDWIDTSGEKANISAVPGLKQGVWKIVELVPDIRRKALIWAAFDSGFRLSEIINVKNKDVEIKDGIYYITCTKSKTKPRTVSLPISSELVNRWAEKRPGKNDPEALFFQSTISSFKKAINIYGERALDKHIHIHMLRHTSATYYATRLDRTNLCKRFGWSYNSAMPDRYIDYAKVEEQKTITLIKSEEYAEIKEANKEIELKNKILSEQLNDMQSKMIDIDRIIKLQQRYMEKNIGKSLDNPK